MWGIGLHSFTAGGSHTIGSSCIFPRVPEGEAINPICSGETETRKKMKSKVAHALTLQLFKIIQFESRVMEPF
uniref:Putative ovule protein n=1 Tax=Solanum chacoense TaxID=4108 RepID=A0A0V0I747_SOLCH